VLLIEYHQLKLVADERKLAILSFRWLGRSEVLKSRPLGERRRRGNNRKLIEMSLHIFTCEPGWENVLVDELRHVFPGLSSRSLGAGWVECRRTGVPPYDRSCEAPCVSFAMQMLAGAEQLEAPSISKWAQLAGDRLIEALQHHDGPWRLHVFAVKSPDAPVGQARCRLVEQAIVELLRKKHRRLLRTRVAEDERPWATDEAFVQLGLSTPSEGFFSAVLPSGRVHLSRALSRFPGGVVEIPPDRAAPSRAFAKLAEVELRLGRRIAAGVTCVDLGASPGSWTYLALARGARVTAVDRSPLRNDLMANPRLTFVRGDAFRYEPPEPVDWLLCDVIAYPERSFELLETWLARRWCRWFWTGRISEARRLQSRPCPNRRRVLPAAAVCE
jgi:23S rRNA (cytidine2498-2'-O)-methyltransferase